MTAPDPPVPSPKLQLYCVGLPVDAVASKVTGWPGWGEPGLTPKCAIRPGPPPPEMRTDRRPVAAPQEEFVAVTLFWPTLAHETCMLLPVVPPEMLPPEVFQLQPDGLGLQIWASAVK